MENINAIFLLKVIALFVLVLLAYISRRTLKDADIGALGDDNEGKRIIVFKLIFNLYLYLALVLILIARLFEFLSNELFIALFIAGLAGLGIKLSSDIIKKYYGRIIYNNNNRCCCVKGIGS
ncbi:MAG: hypothetical protein PHF84_10320 [bacterium]|nr:hypothetical protein [bacterium]